MIKNSFILSLLMLQLHASEHFFNSKEQIKRRLKEMVRADQEMRFKIMDSSIPQDIDESAKLALERIDKENITCLRQILSQYNWVTISEFDKEADHNAWLLVQHADNDPEFQKDILTRLEKLYPSHETSPVNYAYLYDRVAINEGRPQRYGTQGTISNGKWIAYLIEDQDNLDAHRKSVGLPSFQEYLDMVKQSIAILKCHE